MLIRPCFLHCAKLCRDEDTSDAIAHVLRAAYAFQVWVIHAGNIRTPSLCAEHVWEHAYTALVCGTCVGTYVHRTCVRNSAEIRLLLHALT